MKNKVCIVCGWNILWEGSLPPACTIHRYEQVVSAVAKLEAEARLTKRAADVKPQSPRKVKIRKASHR